MLGREVVAAALRARKGRPLLLIDLAVPRDLDPAINELESCFLYDVDDLEAVVAETLAGRRGEAARAEGLVAAEAERFRDWQASLDVVPTIASLRARAEEIRDSELARVGSRPLGAERRRSSRSPSQIVKKLLHLPTVRMKEAAAAADGVVYADACGTCSGWARRRGADEDSVASTRPLPLQTPTAFVRVRPSSGLPAARAAAASDTLCAAMLCSSASAPAAVGSRSPRPSRPPSGCAGRGSRSRSSRSRRRATATGRSRSARSARAASS